LKVDSKLSPSSVKMFGKLPLPIIALASLLVSFATLRRMHIFSPGNPVQVFDKSSRALSIISSNNIDNAAPAGPIPHILWFTYRHDLLQKKEPKIFYDNVMKTIHAYRLEWNDMNAPAYFLVDSNCTDLLLEVDRREHTTLAKAFASEHRGALKADLCRVAALYLYGGYYFDVDLEVVRPLRMDPKVSFSTVQDSLLGYFFQAFLAATPGHPVLRENLNTMMEYYVEKKGTCFEEAQLVVGPCTLMEAWKRTSHASHGHTRILRESHLQMHGLFPNVLQRGKGSACHWVVDDPEEIQVYFYSRVMGTHLCEADS
jgi:mannosyltransferase OCH1-like enzyme